MTWVDVRRRVGMVVSVVVASAALGGCGSAEPTDSIAEAAASPPLSAARFLADQERSLMAACAASPQTSVDEPPTTLDVEVGFEPIVGPDCGNGYVDLRATAEGVPFGAHAVHDRPDAGAPVVGYAISGRIGWIDADVIRRSGFDLAELVAAAGATTRAR